MPSPCALLSFTDAVLQACPMIERREPTLGEDAAGDVSGSEMPASVATRVLPIVRRPPSPPRSRRAVWVGMALGLVAVLAFVLVHWRGAIGARLSPPAPQTRQQQQAAAALRAGKLTAADGSGARELYQAALARDPDDLSAREGLVRVANAALAQAQAAIDANHPDVARRDLDLARDLSAPVAAIDRVEASLRHHTGSEAQLADWLAKAAAAAQAGHLDDGDASALALYQQALAMAPDNALVLDRRAALLSRMLAGEGALLAKGDLQGARALVDRVASVDPGHLDLPNAKSRLAAAEQQRQRDLNRLLDRADADWRAHKTDAAIAIWRQALAQAPDTARAHAGLKTAAEAWVQQADHALAQSEFATAQALLDKARALVPDLPSVHVGEQRLHQLRLQRSGLGRTPGERARLGEFLAASERALARGDLVDPPGESAFDFLHQAAAIAPTDPRVLAVNQRFVATVSSCIQTAMIENRLARASGCLDALAAVRPLWPELSSLRTTLARRWLDYADERIGAGELEIAARAVESARRLNPHDPAVAAMAKRIQQARGGL